MEQEFILNAVIFPEGNTFSIIFFVKHSLRLTLCLDDGILVGMCFFDKNPKISKGMHLII